ncbi:hypothetical protein NEMBOFW57_010501 [Staphylotrichum longicolle]|uniref:Uncharacterized protein n=1 Tax=Staphylotrichum longicolle TaxID=669026 RepID=A0AAD4EN76_9PEZI|nr:hypothetical protein NEMBOFW57_010501 [Staphylotrichum longicolle]
MGKSKMDDAAAERIRRARGDKDGFTKRAADAARRNDAGQGQRDAGPRVAATKRGQKGDKK